MTTTDAVHCSVDRAEKLPAGLSGSAVCDAVRKAAAPALAEAGQSPAALSVHITVESETKLVGAATLSGKALREHRIGIADRALNAHAVEMLANAIAADIASVRR
jgi:hypothetical protein